MQVGSPKNDAWFEDFKKNKDVTFNTVKEKFYPSLFMFAEYILDGKANNYKAAEAVTYALLLASQDRSSFLTMDSLVNYLYSATSEYCISILTSSATQTLFSIPYRKKEENTDLKRRVENALLITRLLETLLEKSRRLPEEQALIFQLHYLQKKKPAEISSITGMTEQQIRNAWNDVRKKFPFLRLAEIN